MSKSKIETVNQAFQILRISGLTVKAVPEENAIGIDELEGMMNEFQARNICSSYNFESEPLQNSDANIELAYQKAVEYSLAVRLSTYFGREPTQGMMRTATASLSTWSAASSKTRQIKNPSRMPRGSGSNWGTKAFSRYYREESAAPDKCSTKSLKVNEINNFEYDFSQYLYADETILSYTTKISDGVSLLSSSIQDSKVIMSVKGVKSGAQSILITITTSTGRVNPENVLFQVVEGNL